MSGSEEARGWVLLSRITSRSVLGTISRALPRKPDASLRKGGKHRVEELFFIRVHADSDYRQTECFEAVERCPGGGWPQ